MKRGGTVCGLFLNVSLGRTAKRCDPLFLAVVQASEEAVVNAMVANETMTGLDGRQVLALPHGPLLDLLRRYGRVE